VGLGCGRSDGYVYAIATDREFNASVLLLGRSRADLGLRRYLLTFTYSDSAAPPAIWRDGSEFVILEGPHPWGPFSFVARGSYFGPSNGYDPAFPSKWISRSGQDLWMIYAANFDGCARGLSCAVGYGLTSAPPPHTRTPWRAPSDRRPPRALRARPDRARASPYPSLPDDGDHCRQHHRLAAYPASTSIRNFIACGRGTDDRA